MPEQTYTPSIPEILEKIHTAKSRKERIELLKQYECAPLKYILKAAFDNRIQFNVPITKKIPYTPDEAPEGHSFSTLYMEYRKIPLFCVGGTGERLSKTRREHLFIEMLESVHASEAELLINMINKELEIDGLTPALVLKAYPGLFVDLKAKKEEDNAK